MSSSNPPRSGTLGKKIAAAIIMPALFFALMEGAARLAYPSVAERLVNYQLESLYTNEPVIFTDVEEGGVTFLHAPLFPMLYTGESKTHDGRRILKKKHDKVLRIFFYGGSSTAGSPFGHWGSHAHFLSLMLRAIARPGVRVEVMNFGVGGMGSSRVARLMARTLHHRPDLAVVYTGHNELCDSRFFLDPRSHEESRPITEAAWWAASRSTLVKLASVTLGPRASRPALGFTADQCKARRPLTRQNRRELSATFRRNMTFMAAQLRRHGVRGLMLGQLVNSLTPPACPGGAGDPSPLLDDHPDRDLLLLERRLCAGAELAPERLRQVAQKVLALDPRSAVANHALARLDMEDGRKDRAMLRLAVALAEDRIPRRTTPQYDNFMRALGQSTHMVAYLDVPAVAAKYLDEDPLGDGRLLVDHVHPNITGQKIIAEAIFDRYLAPRRFAVKLLNYRSHDPELLWRTHARAQWYLQAVCERYVDLVADGSDARGRGCIQVLTRRHARARWVMDRRVARSHWEALFYFGLSGDAPSFGEARDLFKHPNLEPR